MPKKQTKRILEPWLCYEVRYEGDQEFGCPCVVWLYSNVKDVDYAAWATFVVSMNYRDTASRREYAKLDEPGVEGIDLGDGRYMGFSVKRKLTLEEFVVLDQACIYDCGRENKPAKKTRSRPEQMVFDAKVKVIENCRGMINKLLSTDRELEEAARWLS